MSLASLCSIHAAEITRVLSTATAGMGSSREYSTANRGELPTSSTGRLQQLTASRRFAFGGQDTEIDAVWYTVIDPQCDNRDMLTITSVKTGAALGQYFVHGEVNFDAVDRLYRVELRNFSRGRQ